MKSMTPLEMVKFQKFAEIITNLLYGEYVYFEEDENNKCVTVRCGNRMYIVSDLEILSVKCLRVLCEHVVANLY